MTPDSKTCRGSSRSMALNAAWETVARSQSLIPPSEVDGFKREWIRDFSTPVQSLPESFIQLLLTTPEAIQVNSDPDPLFRELHRELQQAKLRKLRTYCEKRGLGITREHTRSDTGGIYLHLDRCPMKPDDLTGDGDPCFKVTTEGTHYFTCRHAKCADRCFGDVEEAPGCTESGHPLWPRHPTDAR